ncbi:MAG: hypothetical protein GX304_01970 [Clostridiales bacterium]|jgi:hypothetical protein|nr:hypothetical protein [Clostridiales bacterium]
MKKAKTPSLLQGATDLLSMLSGLASGKKSESAPAQSAPRDEGDSGAKRFSLDPPDYLPNAYADIIERHDRIVRNILKNHGKDNG